VHPAASAVYADRLAHRGYDLILVARDAARLEALAERLRAETGRAIEVTSADLAVPSSVARIANRLETDPAITLLVS
jgi:short-subunit dehydrogenase